MPWAAPKADVINCDKSSKNLLWLCIFFTAKYLFPQTLRHIANSLSPQETGYRTATHSVPDIAAGYNAVTALLSVLTDCS